MIKQLYRFLSPKFQNLFLEYKVILQPRYGHGKKAHNELYEIINANRRHYANLLTKALTYQETICKIQDSSKESDPLKPSWNNKFLPGLDIIGIYTMLSEYKPNNYIEIGSGHSTKVAY